MAELQAEAKLKEAQAKLKEAEAKLVESEGKLKECEAPERREIDNFRKGAANGCIKSIGFFLLEAKK